MAKLHDDGTVPETLDVLCAKEMQRRLTAPSMAMPSKKCSKSKIKSAPAMPLLPPRPYVEESSRGGGDLSKTFPISLAMVAQLIERTKVAQTKGGKEAILAEWEIYRSGTAGTWRMPKIGTMYSGKPHRMAE